MTDDRIHITVEEDMAVYDALPVRLRNFLDTAPLGLDATTVAELYEKKKDAAWGDEDDPIAMVLVVLRQYIRMQGVDDFRKVEVLPWRVKLVRRERKYRYPKRLLSR